jgi:hypothetical protein
MVQAVRYDPMREGWEPSPERCSKPSDD